MAERLELDAELMVGSLALSLRLASSAERIAIVGPSGAGKTTCLRLLAGLVHPTRGRICFEESTWLDTSDDSYVKPWEREVGWVPQEALLFPHRSVAANLGWSGKSSEAEVAGLAEWLEIDRLLDRKPKNLSGGELRRVALGRALLRKPRLLLLDEPFAALDPPMRDRIASRLRAHCEARRLPFVLVSHDTVDLKRMDVERWVLGDGRLEPPRMSDEPRGGSSGTSEP